MISFNIYLGHLSHLYGNSFPVFVVFLQHTLGTWQASLLLCTPMASCPNFLAPNSPQMGPGQFQIYSTSSAQKILPTERLWDVSLRPSSPGGASSGVHFETSKMLPHNSLKPEPASFLPSDSFSVVRCWPARQPLYKVAHYMGRSEMTYPSAYCANIPCHHRHTMGQRQAYHGATALTSKDTTVGAWLKNLHISNNIMLDANLT